MKNKINIGWIGSGFIGQVAHLINFNQNKNCTIHGLSELREDLLKNVSQKYAIKNTFKNYRDLIKENLDAVVLIVRRNHTYHFAREILNCNLPLFTEKPMAANSIQADKLLKISNNNNLTYMVGNMRVHDDGVINSKIELDNIFLKNKLGKLISFKIYCNAGNDYVGIDDYFSSNIKAPSEYFHDNGPDFLGKKDKIKFEKFLAYFSHDLNLINYYLGAPIDIFSSKLTNNGGIVTFDYKDFYGSFEYTYLNQSIWQEGLYFYFENGFMEVILPPAFLKNQSAFFKVYDDKKKKLTSSKVHNTWSFKNQANNFIDLIRKDKFNNQSAYNSLQDIILAENIWKKL